MVRTVRSIVATLVCLGCWVIPVTASELPSPTFLFASGSARLIGIGDASVALVDPNGYCTNPGSLALSFGEESFWSEVHFRQPTPSGASFTSTFVAFGGRDMAPINGNWNMAFAYSQQSALVPGYGTLPSYPSIQDNLDGVVFAGRPLSYSMAGMGTSQALTIGMCQKGPQQIGLGLNLRRAELDGRHVFDWYTSDKLITAWSLDIGMLVRRTIVLLGSADSSSLKSVTISPSIGLSVVDLIQTKASGYDDAAYVDSLHRLELSRTVTTLAPPEGYVIGPRLTRVGGALTLAAEGDRLPLAELTGAFEYQAGDSLFSGVKLGGELNVFSSVAVRLGYGQMGIHERVRSFGFTLSTAGLQKMLFHPSTESASVAAGTPLWERLHLSVSYASTSLGHSAYPETVGDLPDNYWSISVSL